MEIIQYAAFLVAMAVGAGMVVVACVHTLRSNKVMWPTTALAVLGLLGIGLGLFKGIDFVAGPVSLKTEIRQLREEKVDLSVKLDSIQQIKALQLGGIIFSSEVLIVLDLLEQVSQKENFVTQMSAEKKREKFSGLVLKSNKSISRKALKILLDPLRTRVTPREVEWNSYLQNIRRKTVSFEQRMDLDRGGTLKPKGILAAREMLDQLIATLAAGWISYSQLPVEFTRMRATLGAELESIRDSSVLTVKEKIQKLDAIHARLRVIDNDEIGMQKLLTATFSRIFTLGAELRSLLINSKNMTGEDITNQMALTVKLMQSFRKLDTKSLQAEINFAIKNFKTDPILTSLIDSKSSQHDGVFR